MKTCRRCNETKEYSEFHYNKGNKDGYESRCKLCRKKESREKYQKNPFKTLVRCKKAESKKKNIPFDLTEEYLKELWEPVCPVFNIPITIGNEGKGSSKSAHLDRMYPEEGYVKGNVRFVSARANSIKYNATIEELEKIIEYMKRHERATTISKESTSEV